MKERTYILIEITDRIDRRHDDGRWDNDAACLLKQEVPREKFDLRAVIQAINFPEQLDLRRLAETCAATPAQRCTHTSLRTESPGVAYPATCNTCGTQFHDAASLYDARQRSTPRGDIQANIYTALQNYFAPTPANPIGKWHDMHDGDIDDLAGEIFERVFG